MQVLISCYIAPYKVFLSSDFGGSNNFQIYAKAGHKDVTFNNLIRIYTKWILQGDWSLLKCRKRWSRSETQMSNPDSRMPASSHGVDRLHVCG